MKKFIIAALLTVGVSGLIAAAASAVSSDTAYSCEREDCTM